MTPEEQAFFHQLGRTLLRDFARPIAGSILYGISVGLCGYASYLFHTRRLKGRPAWVILITALVCFLLTTVNFGGLVASISYEFGVVVKRASVIPTNVSGVFTPRDNKRLGNSYVVYFLTQYIILWISDGIVLWRTRALYPDKPHIFWVPIIFLIASTACLTAGFSLEKGLPGWPSTHAQPVGRAVDDIGQALSLLTNVFTTVVVALRLWTHRKWVSKHLNRSKKKNAFTPIQKKLIVLIETGALFCLVQMLAVGCVVTIDIVSATGRVCSGPCMTANWIISRFRFAFAANYSIIVLVLVYSKKSFADTCYSSASHSDEFSTVEVTPSSTDLIDVIELQTRKSSS